MFKSIFIFGSLILLLFRGDLNATTYYVDNVGGNDGNSGTSITLPWKSLAKVSSFSFAAGDIVSFKCGGRFSGVTLSGKSNITFNSYGSGPRPVLDGQQSRQVLNFSGQTNVNFSGLKIIGGLAVNGGNDCNYLYNCTKFTFESCNIDSGYCSEYSSSAKAQLLAELGNHLTIRNSTINYGQNTHGIYVNACSETLLEYDTISYNRAVGINIGYDSNSPYLADSLVVRYSVVKQNGDASAYDDGCQKSSFYYNVFESSSSQQYSCLFYISENSVYNEYGIAPNNNKYYNNTFILHDESGDNQAIDVGGGNSTISHMTNMSFKNNIFYIEGVDYAWLFRGTPANSWTITNNNYYAPGGAGHLFNLGSSYSTISSWNSATGYEANSFISNPLFSNYSGGDFSLQAGSPNLNSGTNVGLTTDIHSNPVPQTPDIGAFQHASASAATYYVANNGSDANSGTSISSPWKTISKVNSKVFIPGDIILFRRGDTWSEILTPQGSGNSTTPVIFDAYGTGNLPIIDGGTTLNNCISLIGVNFITIRNFRLQYAAVNTNGDIHAQSTDNLRIENCDFYITSHGGVFIESSTNGYIGNCTMSSPVSNSDNQADGIYSQRNSTCTFEDNSIVISDIGAGHNDGIQSYLDGDMTFRNNYIYQNNSLTTAQGIDITDGTGTFLVYNNVIKCPNSSGNIIGFNNDVSGTGALRCYQNTVLGNVNCLKVLKCTDVLVKNNIFYSNSATSIVDIGSTLTSGAAIDYNLYYRSGSGSMVLYEPQGYMTYTQWQALGFEAHGLDANPVVNDTLYPATNSPVLNVGFNLGGIFSIDKEGNARPVNGVDLGAYEVKSALPVELSSFTGNYSNNSVLLNWTTSTEINNQGFDIERKSSTSWDKIGFMEGKGNSVIKNNYSFVDKSPIGYKIEYRLKQIDNNGNFTYSNNVEITVVPQDFSIGNYPNPFNPSTKIRYTIPAESMVNMVVYNIIGEKLDELKNEVQQPGTYELNWNGVGHPSGIYFVSITESPTNGVAKNSKTIKMNLIK
ncbi:MAG: right-handed parallel beta-helix repeat-containing protein [Ignavibacteriaceae bacterium]|nr:right-handed parallel beta-helix repeat-containing protein [Ignavibacteriaceae bacterium]